MKKINICHIVSGLVSGGVESMIYNYCQYMSNNRYNFFLLYQHEPSQKNVEEFESLGFSLYRIPEKVKHPIRNYIETYKYLKENAIDVVHCHMTLMNFIPLIAAKQLKIPIRICHSHNYDVRKKNFFVEFFEKVLKKMCINNATDLIACGVEAGKYMYGTRQFTIINNALDTKKFFFSIDKRKKIRTKYNIKDTDILIGHVGRFTFQKNHSFILNIFNKLINIDSNYKLMLVGDGELKKQIEEKAEELKIDKVLIFTGVVDNVNELYSAFDIFVLPSIWEGLPVVGIEAQMAGLNTLFSNNIDKNTIFSNNSKMLPLEENVWVDEIISLGKKSNNRENIAIPHEYDIVQQIKQLESIYTKNN